MVAAASSAESEEFAGRLFWLCGASSGIGFAVAEALARKGASLVIMARNKEKLAQAAEQLKAVGARNVSTAALDITDPASVVSIKDFLSPDSKLDGILCNGGGPAGARASSLRFDDFDHANRLLLGGPAAFLNSLLPWLKAPGGSIVAITSTTVVEPNADLPLSAAYRLGLVAFLKHLSDELGPKGIRVNNVAPGYTNTTRLRTLKQHVAHQQYGVVNAETEQHITENWAAGSALQRIAEPHEIAQACLFLLSSQASFLTGQTLVVDGGQVRCYR